MIEHLIHWNVGDMSDEQLLAELLDMVAKHNPVSFGFNEVGDRTRVLNQFAKQSGYVLTRFLRGDHSGAVALLTRPDVARADSDAFEMTPATAVGKKVAGSHDDGITKPKWAVWQQITLWDLDLTIAEAHLTPTHSVKAVQRLVAVQVAKLVTWLLPRRRIVLLAGDFNETLTERWNLLAPLKAIAQPFSVPSHGRRGIDLWWVKKRHLARLAKAGITASIESLDGYSSDHRPMMLTLTRVEEHTCPVCGLLHRG